MNKIIRNIKSALLLFVMVFSVIGLMENVEAFSTTISGITENRTGLGNITSIDTTSDGKGGYYLGSGTQFFPYKVSSSESSAVFCTLFGAPSPASNSLSLAVSSNATCTKSNWTKEIQVGVGYIINQVVSQNGGSSTFSGNNLQYYYNGEIAINLFLYDQLGNKCNLKNGETGCEKVTGDGIYSIIDTNWELDNDNPSDEVSNLIGNITNVRGAKYAVEDYKNGSLKIDNYSKVDETSLKYDEVTNTYKSNIITVNTESKYQKIYGTVTIKNSDNKEVYSNYGSLETVDETSGQYRVVIKNADDIANGDYTITLLIFGDKYYPGAQNYACSGTPTYLTSVNYQSITPAKTERILSTKQEKLTFSMNAENEETPELELIVNKNSSKGEGLKGAVIRITGVDVDFDETYYMSSSSYVINDFKEYGTYKITEAVAPSGYVLDSTPQQVTFNANSTSKTITFVNAPIDDDEVPPVMIIKKEDENGNKLSGATIKITGVDVAFEKTYVMDTNLLGIEDITEYGTYKIQEIKAPDGYVLDSTVKTVTLSKSNPSELVTIVNVAEVEASANLIIKKIDDKGNLLSGATLRLLDESGYEIQRWTSDGNIKKFYNLPLETYTVEELDAPTGYALSTEKKTIKLSETGETYTVEFKNAPVVKVPDTLSNISKVLIAIGLIGLAIGGWLLYSNKHKQQA